MKPISAGCVASLMTDQITQIEVAASKLHELAKDNEFHIVSCDSLGSFRLTNFAREYPERVHEVGASEAASLAIAFGLASKHRRVVAIGFSSFLLFRGFEILRSQIAYHSANVAVFGGLAGLSHCRDGFMHQSIEDLGLIKQLVGFDVLAPSEPTTTKNSIEYAIKSSHPVFVRLTRLPIRDTELIHYKANGLEPYRELLSGDSIAIVTFGMLTPIVLNAALTLADRGIDIGVFDLVVHRPFPPDLCDRLARYKKVVTVEDHRPYSGVFADLQSSLRGCCEIFALGELDELQLCSGTTEEILAAAGLTKSSIVERICHIDKTLIN